MTVGVFGFIGLIAIITGILLIIINRKQNTGELFENRLDKKIILASFIIITLYVISYFRLPQKSGYIIPLLPFTILLLGYYLNSRNFKLICITFILSPFICSINLTDKLRGAEHSMYAIKGTISGQELFFDPFSGPVFSDYSKRKQKMKYTQKVILKADTIKTKTVIIAGWWYNEIMVEMIPRDNNEQVIYEPYINQNAMHKYLAKSYKISYLPEQNIYNDLMYKMDITNKFSKSF